MKTVGRVYTEWKRLVIDAEPHVMRRVRQVFGDTATAVHTAGRFTHKPVSIPDTLAGARDLVWLMGRYPLTMEDELLGRVEAAATK